MNSFLDSNICIYALDHKDLRKQLIALGLFKQCPAISSQVCIEVYLVLNKKLKYTPFECDKNLVAIMEMSDFKNITESIILSSINLRIKYKFSFLDSIIIATALESNCEILYSEDMHHGLVVENKLTIINPFL